MGIVENLFAPFALVSCVVLVQISESVTDTANNSFTLVSIIGPGPFTRTLSEDFPPKNNFALISCTVITALTRTLSEDFPPTNAFTLVSSTVLAAVTETLPAETPNNNFTLVSCHA